MPKFNPANNKVYCDLDGVLADFDRVKRRHLSKEAQTNDNKMWEEIADFRNFYRELPAMKGANSLWSAIQLAAPLRAILTAIPRKKTMPEAEADKRHWCNVEMLDSVFNGEVVEVLIGPHSKDKQNHCKPGDILIDDRADNIEQWEAKGGIGILHDGDVDATINLLYQHAGILMT